MGPTVHSLCELWDGGVATSIDLKCKGAEFNSELSHVSSTLSHVTSSLSLNPYSAHPSPHCMKKFNQLEPFH